MDKYRLSDCVKLGFDITRIPLDSIEAASDDPVGLCCANLSLMLLLFIGGDTFLLDSVGPDGELRFRPNLIPYAYRGLI
jgi:hypothetical protein